VSETFRFHAPTNIAPGDFIRRLSKREPKRAVHPNLVAADSVSLTNAQGQWPIESYADFVGDSFMTLTRKEADLIALANPGTRPPLALEALYPWLPPQVYMENSRKNFAALKALVNQYGNHFVSPAAYCDKMWNKVCNSVRMKTDMDVRFYTAWHLPVQDTYILEEKRPNRSVVALDYNAMYPSCMQQEFPRPSKMRRVVYDREIKAGEILPAGLYRCKLQSLTSDFIRKYNPFRSFFAGRHLRAALTESLSVDLHEFEIAFFQRHFGQIYVSDAVISDQRIPHPLAREAKRCFARRAHFLSHGNKALADREKFLSTLLSSCTHRPGRLRRRFSSPSSAEKCLRENFGIVADADDPARLFAPWLQGRKAFVITETAEGLLCDTPDVASGHACFVFNQRVIARSRIVLLEMMEKISQIAPDVEICYANVDSIHFSLPDHHLNLVMDALRSGASARMGDYKIDAIAKGGLWLEPGRYWLYSDEIIKFRNRSIRHYGSAFTDHSIHVVNRQIGDLHIPVRLTICMDRSMTDMRSIEYDPVAGLERQRLVELEHRASPSIILSALERNRKQSIPRRIQAFRTLAASLGTVGTRCLETQQNCQSQLGRKSPPIGGVFEEH